MSGEDTGDHVGDEGADGNEITDLGLAYLEGIQSLQASLAENQIAEALSVYLEDLTELRAIPRSCSGRGCRPDAQGMTHETRTTTSTGLSWPQVELG
jgi:hypothetical protein